MGYTWNWLGDDVSGWQLVVLVDPLTCWMDVREVVSLCTPVEFFHANVCLCSQRCCQDNAVRILLAMLCTLHRQISMICHPFTRSVEMFHHTDSPSAKRS